MYIVSGWRVIYIELRNMFFVFGLGLYIILILISGLVFEWWLGFCCDGIFLIVIGVLFGVRIIENLYMLFCNWLLIWIVLMYKDKFWKLWFLFFKVFFVECFMEIFLVVIWKIL